MPNNLFGTWDDLQVSLSSARVPAASAPTWRTFDFGLGGPAFAVLGFAEGDYIDFSMQTSHSMEINSILFNHIHGTLPSNSSGDSVKWQLDVIAGGVGEAFATVAGSPFTEEYILSGDEAAKHNMFDVGEIPAVNTTVSTVYLCRLTRIASTVPKYAPEVYLIFDDAHYKKDAIGSKTKLTKWS